MRSRAQRIADGFLCGVFRTVMGFILVVVGGMLGAIVTAALSGFSAELPSYAAIPIGIGCVLGLLTWVAMLVAERT